MDPQLVAYVTTAIATASLLVSFFIWRAAARQAKAAERQTDLQQQLREDSAQPYVWADVRPNDAQGFLLDLIVGNSGPTVATDVHITFTPPLTCDRTNTTAALTRLESGYASLGPGRTVSWVLGPGPELLASTDPQPRTVTINGEGPFGPLTELSYVIDMTDFRETADRPSGSLHVLTRALNARPTKQDFAKLTDAVEALAPGIDEVESAGADPIGNDRRPSTRSRRAEGSGPREPN